MIFFDSSPSKKYFIKEYRVLKTHIFFNIFSSHKLSILRDLAQILSITYFLWSTIIYIITDANDNLQGDIFYCPLLSWLFFSGVQQIIHFFKYKLPVQFRYFFVFYCFGLPVICKNVNYATRYICWLCLNCKPRFVV